MEYLILALGLFIILCQMFLFHGNIVLGVGAGILLLTITGASIILKRMGKPVPGKGKMMVIMVVFLAVVAPFMDLGQNNYTKRCKKVESYIDQGKYEKAQEELDFLKEEYRESDVLHFLTAKMNYKQGKYGEALEECEKVKDKNEEYYYLKSLAISRDLSVSEDKALSFFEEGAMEYPEWEFIQIRAGAYELKAKNYRKAEHYIRNALSINENNPLACFYMGMIFYYQGEYEEALDYFIKSTDNGANEEMNAIMHECVVDMQGKLAS